VKGNYQSTEAAIPRRQKKKGGIAKESSEEDSTRLSSANQNWVPNQRREKESLGARPSHSVLSKKKTIQKRADAKSTYWKGVGGSDIRRTGTQCRRLKKPGGAK